MKRKISVMLIAGARPNFVKIAPLYKAFKKKSIFEPIIVHTGQHYDHAMSRVFFEDLGIAEPTVNLEVGSGSHAVQTGKIMVAFDELVEKSRPDLVVVVGDVNSTVACSLVAAKRGILVAHVEAGLRSFDKEMPEEVNRVVTDKLSDMLFCTEISAVKNLKAEGVASKRIFFVGNVMIDTLVSQKKRAEKTSRILEQLKIKKKKYALVTLHRPSNVDDPQNLARLFSIFHKVAEKGLRVIFPVHPRTNKKIEQHRIKTACVDLVQPLGYIDFLKLMSHATVVLTDSGGIQEETTALGVPCLTLRNNTERPVTITEGTNQLVGTNERKIFAVLSKILKKSASKKTKRPQFWDGKAAERIVKIIARKFL